MSQFNRRRDLAREVFQLQFEPPVLCPNRRKGTEDEPCVVGRAIRSKRTGAATAGGVSAWTKLPELRMVIGNLVTVRVDHDAAGPPIEIE